MAVSTGEGESDQSRAREISDPVVEKIPAGSAADKLIIDERSGAQVAIRYPETAMRECEIAEISRRIEHELGLNKRGGTS